MSTGYIHTVAALAKQRRQTLSLAIGKEKARDELESFKDHSLAVPGDYLIAIIFNTIWL